jgi:hypothetical protein
MGLCYSYTNKNKIIKENKSNHKLNKNNRSKVNELFKNINNNLNIEKKEKKENINKKYKKKSIPKTLKRLVWDKWVGKDIGTTKCLCCNHIEIRQIEFHCGHIIAESNGGETNVDNLKPICAQCNLSMKTMDMNEFKKKFFK